MTLGSAIRFGVLDVAVIVRVWLSLPAPLVMPVRLIVWAPLSSLIVTFAIGSRVGESFTALTVARKVLVTTLLEPPPSLTVTVMVALPLAFAAGLRLRLPFAFGL